MDVDSSQRQMAAYLRDHQDKLVGRWTELVVTGLRGRSSATEVRRELEDLYSLLIRAISGADDQAAGELRAALAELSRSRPASAPRSCSTCHRRPRPSARWCWPTTTAPSDRC